MDNWFTAQPEAEALLAAPLARAVPNRDLIRSALKALCLKLHLTDGAAGALFNAGVTPADLAVAFDALVAELPESHRPAGVIVRAMAYVAQVFPDVRMLKASQQLDQAVAIALVRILSEELFPLTGRTPDPDADMRWAVTELLTFRKLQAGTLSALPPASRRLVADRLEAQLPLLLAVSPPAGQLAMQEVVTTAAALLRREPPVMIEELNAAIALR